MKCPHCLIAVHVEWSPQPLASDNHADWEVSYTTCPACGKHIIKLGRTPNPTATNRSPRTESFLVYPKGISRSPIPAEVPPEFVGDYEEACKVLSDSPKASAALSRRCLQYLLREKGSVKPSNLDDEIKEILSKEVLPSSLAEAVDAVRVVGNFAAHPIKSKNTGEIVDVEPGEAEWLLDVLEGLFDHFFIQPTLMKKKRDALNQKLQDAGKPPLK